MKRSKFNILMALFVALSVVPACGEDSNNQNPAEGEGEGETDSGTPEPDSGEGEGEGMSECEQCLQACAGGTCAVSCQALCDTPDPCELDWEGFECQNKMTADFLWFNGVWRCEEGYYCGENEYPTIQVQWWYPDRGVQIRGFLGRDGDLYFEKDSESGLFTGQFEDSLGKVTAEADPATRILTLGEYATDGSLLKFFHRYSKQ